MPYSDLAVEEQILLAAEFVGRGLPVPSEIKSNLGSDLIRDIENPETTNDRDQERERPGHRPSGR
jgi:hypothetical protein